MANYCSSMLTLSLLILATMQGCSAELSCPEEANPMTSEQVLQVVSETMDCFEDIIQESLRVQKQNSDTITSLEYLPVKVRTLNQEIADLKKQLVGEKEKVRHLEDKLMQSQQQLEEQTENEKLLNNTVTDLEDKMMQSQQLLEKQSETEERLNDTVHKLEAELKAKNEELDKKVRDLEDNLKQSQKLLEEKSENEKQLKNLVGDLEVKLQQSRQKLDEQSENEKRLNDTVQELSRKLKESQQKVDELTETVKMQADTVASQSITPTCVSQEKITQLVQEYSKSGNWARLRRGLEAALDHDSEAYSQLQGVLYGESEPLLWVARDGLEQLASLLLCSGLPVDGAVTARGHTLLDVAAEAGRPSVVKLLLDRGADTSAKRGAQGMTPLMWAAQGGHPSIVWRLLRAGADPAATRTDGSTASDLAELFGRTAAAQLLRSHR